MDDDRVQCPNAGYVSVQDAVSAADPGDTVRVCAGLYQEGEAGPANSALTIDKPLQIVGAGAGLVRVEPTGDIGDQLSYRKVIRDDAGNVILVKHTSGVTISGITVAAGDPDEPRGMKHAEAGVVFHNSSGLVRNSVVTDIVPPTVVDYSTNIGYGVAAFTDPDPSADPADDPPATSFALSGTLIEGHAKGGVLVSSRDAALGATLGGNVIRGRGVRSEPGQGQNGVQIHGQAASAQITGNSIVDHFFAPDESASAGVRLDDADAAATEIHGNDFRGNGYGVFSAAESGCDAAVTVDATANWWGHPDGPSPTPTPLTCATELYTINGPRAAGDRVNGSAVDYAGFRTAPHGAPTAPGSQADAAPQITRVSPADGAVVPPSSAVEISADASDDFDIANVQFLRGSTVVGTATKRPYATTITSPGPGSSTAITVRATDSSGQTTSRSIAIQGEAPPAPTPLPEPQQPQQPQQQQPAADDRPPAVTITSPSEGAAIDPRFAPRITADASDDRGVARVGFLDDGRLVCIDESAPFECDYAPRGDDVGRNTLIAIAVDGTGQTAVDFRAVRVGKFTPRLTAKTTPKRDRRRPYRYATRGSVVPPPGISAEEACASGGTVSVEITAGKLKLPLTALLKPDCTYRTSIAFPTRRPLGRGGRLIVKTRFGGNEVLAPARAKSQRVRAG